MKIFVTGGTGFIGSHFIKIAIAEKHDITALRRAGSTPKIDLPISPNWLNKQLEEVGPEDLIGIDAIVHFASVGVSPKQATWEELMRINVFSSIHLLKQAKLAKIKRVVFAGTFAEYGLAGLNYEKIPPSAPLLPTNAYAGSKAAAFALSFAFSVENNLEFCYLRIFSAFGEGQCSENIWPSLRASALAGLDFEMTLGEQIRDYIPVEVVAKYFLLACKRKDVTQGIPLQLNVGSGNPISIREFAQHWWYDQWRAKGKLKIGALPYRRGEVMRFAPEIESGINVQIS